MSKSYDADRSEGGEKSVNEVSNQGLKVIDLKDWLETKATRSETQKSFRQAAFYWAQLLSRLTRVNYMERFDVTKLAAIHFRLGMNHRALRDTMKSLYHLKYSIRLNSSEPRYYEAFGRAFLNGGHWRVAKAQFEKAISLDPKDSALRRQYAGILALMGKVKDAEESYEKAISLDPDDQESWWGLIHLFKDSNQTLKAVFTLERFLEKMPESERPPIREALEGCHLSFDESFEGTVLRYITKGIKCDGRPFVLADLKRAQEIWLEFCIASYRSEDTTLEKLALPHVWAAACLYFVFVCRSDTETQLLEKWPTLLDELMQRFSTDSVEVWPCMKRLQEFKQPSRMVS